jgi:hypothetical protein
VKWMFNGFGPAHRAVGTVVLIALCLVAGPVHAATLWDEGLVRLSDLQAGAEFESGNGAFTFSDFEVTPTGVDEWALSSYLVAPADNGFKILLGFGSPFAPEATLDMSYRVTANGPLAIEGASIPRLQLMGAVDGTARAEVTLTDSNGLSRGGSSMMANETVNFSGTKGVLWVENAFQSVPEPGTGLLLAAGLGACVVSRRRSAV